VTIQITNKKTINLNGTRITVGQLTEALKGHNPSEQVWVRFSAGDPRDPREYDTVRLEIG
jgi:hypothetical protein